jgi:hypothetical protein
MAIVSISEAARLTGKSRTTIQRQIRAGKLSKCTDSSGMEGIDTSELLRVFGSFVAPAHVHDANKQTIHHEAANTASTVHLETEINLLKKLLEEKDKRIMEIQQHNDTLKQAMLLLENKQTEQNAELEKDKKPWWKILS